MADGCPFTHLGLGAATLPDSLPAQRHVVGNEELLELLPGDEAVTVNIHQVEQFVQVRSLLLGQILDWEDQIKLLTGLVSPSWLCERGRS